MDQSGGYSFDPLANKGRNRLLKSGAGATAVAGTTYRATSSCSGVTIVGGRHNIDGAPLAPVTGYGYGKHKPSDNVCFSNIRQITVNKENAVSSPTLGENGDDVKIRINDELVIDDSGVDSEDQEHQGKRTNAASTSDSGVSVTAHITTDGTPSESVAKTRASASFSSYSSTSTATLGGSTGTSTTTAATTSHLPTLNLNLNLPPLTETVTYGFGVKMVATSASQQLIYRSVPPRPLSYTLTDVLDVTGPLGSKHRSKTAPVSTNTPEEYAQRFKSRPTTRPKVVEFDGSVVSSKFKRSIATPGFPTARARIYIGRPKSKSPDEITEPLASKSPRSRLHLQPLGSGNSRYQSLTTQSTTPGPHSSRTHFTERQSLLPGTHSNINNYTQYNPSRTLTKSATSSILGNPTKSTTSTGKPSESLRETSQSIELTTSIPQDLLFDTDDHIHNPDLLLTCSTDCDDLSILPPPKKVLPKRELPWVFRYKVKRGMNALSKIMASKPAPNVLHSSHAFT